MLFSKDGEHYAYTAKHGSTWRVVRDGIAQPDYAAIGNNYQDPEFSNLNFSLDGLHLSYLVTKKGKDLIVVDSKEYSRNDPSVKSFLADVERINPPYSYPQVMHTTTSYISISNIKGRKYHIKNVVVPAKYSSMLTVPFLEYGADNTFLAHQGDKELVVTDGKEGPLYDQVLQLQAIPAHPGVAYVARKGKQYFVVCRDIVGPAYDGIIDRSLCFSLDGSRMAYRAKKGSSEIMVVDGQENPPCAMITDNSFVFSADSKHYHYSIPGNKGVQLVIDDKIVNPDSAAYSLDSFTPGGEWVCRVTQDGKQAVICAGMTAPGKFYDDIYKNRDGVAVFFDSPKSYHYFARKENALLRVDEMIR